MPHSPANSADSTSIRASSPLPPPFEEWLLSMTPEMLAPHGHIPEFARVARRNSLSGGSRITMRRQIVTLKLNNADLYAHVGLVFMTFAPPDPPGGVDFEVRIPWTWWKTQKRGNDRPFTFKNIHNALRDEVVARIQGRESPGTLVRKYIPDLRDELEECVKNLPSATFILGEGEDGEMTLPSPSRWQQWSVAYGEVSSTSVRLSIRRDGDGDVDVAVDLEVPFSLLEQSPGTVSDWILMQIGL